MVCALKTDFAQTNFHAARKPSCILYHSSRGNLLFADSHVAANSKEEYKDKIYKTFELYDDLGSYQGAYYVLPGSNGLVLEIH